MIEIIKENPEFFMGAIVMLIVILAFVIRASKNHLRNQEDQERKL